MSATILVVNVSETDLQNISDALHEYNILIAPNSREAIRVISLHSEIDLIILDLDISDIDGFRLLCALKSEDKYKRLRTILLIDTDEAENDIKGLGFGAADYIRKPIQGEFLKAHIKLHFELIEQQMYIEELHKRTIIYDTIFQQAPIGIVVLGCNEGFMDNSNKLYSINSMSEQILGRTKEELIKLGWANITHPGDIEEEMKNYKRLQSGEIKSYSMEKRFIKPDGSIVWVYMVVASLVLDKEDKLNYIFIRDISEQKETTNALAESERSKSVLLSHLPGMAYRCNYDRDWTMQFVSAGSLELTGYSTDNLLYNRKMSFNSLIAPEYRNRLWEEWERILAKRSLFKYEYEIITAKGERKWVLEMGQGVYNEQGEVKALEGIILDISDRKEIEDNLRYNNEHDIWTGLYNQRYLEKLLENDAKISTEENRAVIGINISTMQLFTMNYGFYYSQELIKKVADALNFHRSHKNLLFKTCENRFIFYIKGYKDKGQLIAFCKAVADTLEPIFTIERINGGIGVVEIDGNNKHDIEQLLKNLLIASEKAINTLDKEIGICFFDRDMEVQITREEEIKRELAEIAADIKRDRLLLQFQPILDLKSNQICGFEALARLNSDRFGLVSPIEFIPIAEKTKLIIPLGEKIIIKAFDFLKKLDKNGYNAISVSINISAIQLLGKDFTKNLCEMINEVQVNPANISLEITESIFASNYENINSIIGELKDFGIKIALDDFGTGYSSFARERELSINCLKIDKYFIDKLLLLNEEEAITSDIISMAHRLGQCVIAEGIEHEKQRQYLEKYRCDKIQGYLISRPLDEKLAIELLKNKTSINK